MARKSRRMSGEGPQTPAQRGLKDRDSLLLHEITERPGLPVLFARAAHVMRERGSQISDEQLRKMLCPRPPTVKSRALRDILDLETQTGGFKASGPRTNVYICWRGTPGAAHRDNLLNPPAEIGIDALAALQQLLDEHSAVVRGKMQGRDGCCAAAQHLRRLPAAPMAAPLALIRPPSSAVPMAGEQ